MQTGEQTSTQANGETEADPFVKKVDQLAEDFQPAVETLAGDLRDSYLQIIKHLPKTWAALLYKEQVKAAYAIQDFCRSAARKCSYVSVAFNHKIIGMKVDEIKVNDKGVSGKFTIMSAPESDAFDLVTALMRLRGKTLPLVLADIDMYLGEKAPMDIRPDQPDLPLGEADGRAKIDAPDGGAKIDAELDTIIAGDDSQQPAAAIGNLAAERQAAERDPFAAGKAAALHGFNETRNPFSHPSVESADWLRGFAEGEAERGRSANIAAAMESSKRRRRRRGIGQESVETPA